jgi:hypothetical protein
VGLRTRQQGLGRLHYEEFYDVIKYDSGDQIKDFEMGGSCGTNEGRGEVCGGFWWGNRREREYL